MNFEILDMLREVDDLGLERRHLVTHMNSLKFAQVGEAFGWLSIELRQNDYVGDALSYVLSLRQLINKLLLPPGLLIRIGSGLDGNEAFIS